MLHTRNTLTYCGTCHYIFKQHGRNVVSTERQTVLTVEQQTHTVAQKWTTLTRTTKFSPCWGSNSNSRRSVSNDGWVRVKNKCGNIRRRYSWPASDVKSRPSSTSATANTHTATYCTLKAWWQKPALSAQSWVNTKVFLFFRHMRMCPSSSRIVLQRHPLRWLNDTLQPRNSAQK